MIMADVSKLFLVLFALRAQHTLCMLPLSDATVCDKKRSRSSYLWRVDNTPPIYLFGTMHVPYTLVWDHIAPAVKESFAQADEVYFELDLIDHRTASHLDSCQVLPNRQQISDFILPELFERLQQYFLKIRRIFPNWLSDFSTERDPYADFLFDSLTYNWQRKRPIWLMLLLTNLTPKNIRQRGIPVLDVFLQQEAHRRNKLSGAIETAREQCEALNRLNLDQAIFALNLTLSYYESHTMDYDAWNHENEIDDKSETDYNVANRWDAQQRDDNIILQKYNCGQLYSTLNQGVMQIEKKIMRLRISEDSVKKAAAIDAYFQREIIQLRNNHMASRIIELLHYDSYNGQKDKRHQRGSIFIALGAGHLMGLNGSVVEQLRAAGFSVTAIPRELDKINSMRKSVTSRPQNKYFQELWQKVKDREEFKMNPNLPQEPSQQTVKAISGQLESNFILGMLALIFIMHLFSIHV